MLDDIPPDLRDMMKDSFCVIADRFPSVFRQIMRAAKELDSESPDMARHGRMMFDLLRRESYANAFRSRVLERHNDAAVYELVEALSDVVGNQKKGWELALAPKLLAVSKQYVVPRHLSKTA